MSPPSVGGILKERRLSSSLLCIIPQKKLPEKKITFHFGSITTGRDQERESSFVSDSVWLQAESGCKSSIYLLLQRFCTRNLSSVSIVGLFCEISCVIGGVLVSARKVGRREAQQS